MPGPWGKAIESLRIQKRLTRQTVAKRAKMTPGTYGRIERGHHTQTRKLQDIADVFGVPIDRVLQNPLLQSVETLIDTAASPGSHKEASHGGSDSISAAGTIDIQALTAEIERRLRAQGLVGGVQRAATAGRRSARTRRGHSKRSKKAS